MAQKLLTRYFSKDVTVVMTFKRLQSDVDGADTMARDLLAAATSNRLSDVLRVTGYKVNQVITTEDWDKESVAKLTQGTSKEKFSLTPAFKRS